MAMRLKLIQIYLIALIVFSRVLDRTLLTVSILLVIKVFPTTWNKTYTHHLNLLVLTYQKWEKNNKLFVIKNSCGYDHISSKLLKRISEFIEEPLGLIINQSLCSGIFPDMLKIVKAIPLFKKVDQHLLDNYRPISLLPVISKLFEKTIFKQTYEYITVNKLSYSSQYGFRKGHSTELASIELVNRASKYLNSGKWPISVFLIYQKRLIRSIILFCKIN